MTLNSVLNAISFRPLKTDMISHRTNNSLISRAMCRIYFKTFAIEK